MYESFKNISVFERFSQENLSGSLLMIEGSQESIHHSLLGNTEKIFHRAEDVICLKEIILKKFNHEAMLKMAKLPLDSPDFRVG